MGVMKSCTVQELKEALGQGGESVYFIDVRTIGEHKFGHIPGTVNLPLGRGYPDLEKYKTGTVYLYCQSGGRSYRAALELERFGVENVVNVEGGFAEWAQAGFSVERLIV